MTKTMTSKNGTNSNTSTSSSNVFKDLNMTQDEVSRFSEAFKKEEFRKLFQEYVDELQNPEQRALYENEIAQLEEERGMEVEFIHPTAGHVIKLSQPEGRKVFLNICTSDKIAVATVQRSEQNGKAGANWSIPHSFAPPREDLDKAKRTCLVIDAVFHPDTYLMASRNAQFKKMMEDTAVQGAEKNFQLKFVSGSLKRPKMTFKGVPQATVIRRKRADFDAKQAQLKADPNPFVQHFNQTQGGETQTTGREFDLRPDDGALKRQDHAAEPPRRPKHQMKYCYKSDFTDFAYESPGDDGNSGGHQAAASQRVPHSIQVTIDLPGIPTAQAIDVDIEDRQLRVTCEEPQRYRLELRLPHPVVEADGTAKFDKKSHRLVLTLPCAQQQQQQQSAASAEAASSAPTPTNQAPPALIQELSSTAVGDCQQLSPPANADVAKPPSRFQPGQLPPLDCLRLRQTSTHATLLIGVKNCLPETVVVVDVTQQAAAGDSNGWWCVSFTSQGSGGWRCQYSLAVPAQSLGLTCDSVDSTGGENLLVRFVKSTSAPPGSDWLDGLPVSAVPEAAAATRLVNAASKDPTRQLADRLTRFTGCQAPAAVSLSSSSSQAGLIVTEMTGDTLCVRLDGEGLDIREKLPELQQQQQQQQQPLLPPPPTQPQSRLQGILKYTRSPSLSSSDDLSSSLSSSQGYQQLQQQQSLPQQQQQQQHLLLNRSVSFSDHVESANYSSSASISAFHQTLRNRKKRHKQRETRRRRHNSDTLGATELMNERAAGDSGGGDGTTRRIRRTSEGCAPTSFAYADNDEEDDEGGDELPTSPPPPPTQPLPFRQVAKSSLNQQQQQQQQQLTNSIIFELDDD